LTHTHLDIRLPVVHQQNVLWFQVAVHDAVLPQKTERCQDLLGNIYNELQAAALQEYQASPLLMIPALVLDFQRPHVKQ
jgi:hypothetical protein